MSNKILNLLAIACVISLPSFGQIPEDVLKYSWQPINGTARFTAIGGASTAIGGDITSNFTNPAGIGMFRTGDLTLTPSILSIKNSINFRDEISNGNSATKQFGAGASGFVFRIPTYNNKNNAAFSLAVTKTANYKDEVYYTGQNNFSSFAEQYAAEAANSGLSFDDMLNNSGISVPTKMAIENYLIDSATIRGNATPDVISIAMYDNLKNGGQYLTTQTKSTTTTGNSTRIAMSLAGGYNDKFYIGGALGIDILDYNKTNIFTEADATLKSNNYFNYTRLYEETSTKGLGLNVTAGMIYNLNEIAKFGLSIQTPTFYTLTDGYYGHMEVDLENYRTTPGVTHSYSQDYTKARDAFYEYSLNTPWKINAGLAFVINSVEDVKQQRGFITADVEYLAYTGNKFSSSTYDNSNKEFYNSLNSTVKRYYKNALNFKVGGELKFNTLMGRLGFAYYSSPYKEKVFEANKMYISGGLGYRNHGMYIDLTYRHGIQKDVDFPYRLPDKANTYANIDSRAGDLFLTLGFKLR